MVLPTLAVSISYPESSGSLASGWSPGETCTRLWLCPLSNKLFYSCLLSDPAYEWQRGCRLFGPRCFYHVNCVVVMLTSLHLHKKSKELCIKTKSPAASLSFIGRVTEPQLKNGLLGGRRVELSTQAKCN